MSLDYIKVLDDRISSLLKIEGLIITILVATVSITLNLGEITVISSIKNSLIGFLIFFIVSLSVYVGLSSYTFKKREEISEKSENLKDVQRWQNICEYVEIQYGGFFKEFDNYAQRERFLKTQPQDISNFIVGVFRTINVPTTVKATKAFAEIKNMLFIFRNFLNRDQNVRNLWSEGEINFDDVSKRIFINISLEYDNLIQWSKKLVKGFELGVVICYILFSLVIIYSLLIFIQAIPTTPSAMIQTYLSYFVQSK